MKKANGKKITAQQRKEQLVFDEAFFERMDQNLLPYQQIFGATGIPVDRDRLILNEIVRQIMHSGVLEGKPVDIIISDQKMKTMLDGWFAGDI